MRMRFLKTTLPVALAFVMGLVGIGIYFIPHRIAAGVQVEVSVWNKVIGSVTMFIGSYGLLRHHWGKIRRGHAGWAYSVLLYVFFALTLAVGIYNSGSGPLVKRPAAADDGLQWLYSAICKPAGATIFASLGFFICSAAYRTFRAKTPQAALLLVAALVVMLGQVPLSGDIGIPVPARDHETWRLAWLRFKDISCWLMDVPNMAVKRAILFGICLGSVGTSLRVLFGIERSYMGGDK
jgi:hypothetical protein